jgi:hypothetical protein
VFGIAAASRNTRFQAARYGLTWAGLAPADRASFGLRLHHLVGALLERRYLKLIKSVRLSVEALGFKGSFLAFALF